MSEASAALAVLATAIFACAAPLAAQRAPRAPLVLELPASTRALGMGNAFLLGSDDADAVFYNPSFAEGLRGFSLAAQRYGDESTLFTAAGGGEWLGGGLGVGLQALDYAVAPGGAGVHEREQDLLGGITTTGAEPVAVSERAATLAFGHRIRGVRAGLAGKLIQQRHGPHETATVAADAAVGADTHGLAIGLAVHDFGRDLRIDGAPVPLPTRVSLQLATRRSITLGPLDLRAAAQLTRSRGGTLLPGGGLELDYWPVIGRTFYARAGARRVEDFDGNPLTLGVGFTGDDIGLDYAYEPFGASGRVHRLGVRWKP